MRLNVSSPVFTCQTVFSQEFNPAWPQLPSGKLLSDLMEVFAEENVFFRRLMSRSMEMKDLKGRDKEMYSIRNMLRECGEFITEEGRDKWRRRLYELYKQNIEDQEAPHGGS